MRIVLLGRHPGPARGTQVANCWSRPTACRRYRPADPVARGGGRRAPSWGLRAKSAMDCGKLVDDVTVLGDDPRKVEPTRRRPKASYLDGFPRNIAQADALAKVLDCIGRPLRGGGIAEPGTQGVLFKAA